MQEPLTERTAVALVLRLRNSSLTLGGLFCCDLHRMTLVIGFATVGWRREAEADESSLI